MKNILATFFVLITILAGQGSYARHSMHAKHNMVLFGVSDVFASHIVYKVPHNYQVILNLEFDKREKELYLKESSLHPADEFIFLLDDMDIKDIASVPSISGVISRTDAGGNRIEIIKNVQVDRKHFKVLYFDELPLSLEATHTPEMALLPAQSPPKSSSVKGKVCRKDGTAKDRQCYICHNVDEKNQTIGDVFYECNYN